MRTHGTRSAYTNDGCRCDLCRTANADYWRSWSHLTGRRSPRQPSTDSSPSGDNVTDRSLAPFPLEREAVTKKEAAQLLRDQANDMDCAMDGAHPRDLDRWAANLRYIAEQLTLDVERATA